MDQIAALERIGLSEKEAKIYLSLLQLGESTVQHIAGHAGVNRPTAYVVLESLIAKGLCSLFKTGGKAKYFAEQPLNLVTFVTLKKREFEAHEAEARKLVQELESIPGKSKAGPEPFIRYFSGKRGIVAMRNDMFESRNNTLRLLYSLDKYEQAFEDLERKDAHAMRVKKNIFAKILYRSNKNTITNDKSREAKKIPKGFPVSADFAIYNDKVRLSLFEGDSGVIIKNKKIAETMTTLFDLAWAKLK